MNKTQLTTTTNSDNEKGTTLSYIIGFALSLVFTIIPYYLVVNNSATDSVLLATILGFAVLQMFIQIFFFLHLGRGPKPLYNVVFFFATVAAIFVIVAGSIFIMNNLYQNMSPADVTKKLAEKEGIYQVSGEKTGACQGLYENHKIVIKDGIISPAHTEARLCDTLTFINEDDSVREMAFGVHPGHDIYGGETEVVVRKGRTKTITLNQTGQYSFHDHLEPATAGDFAVTQR